MCFILYLFQNAIEWMRIAKANVSYAYTHDVTQSVCKNTINSLALCLIYVTFCNFEEKRGIMFHK